MNRWLGTLFVGASIAAFGLTGCGDDSSEDDDGSDGGGTQTQVNTQAAASLGTTASSAIAQVQAGNGSAAAFALLGAGNTAWTVITPGSGSAAQSAELGTAAQTACETECSGDGTSGSCTFTGCSDGTWAIEGSFSWGDGSLDADYVVTGNVQGSTWNMNVFADLTYTETSLDGVLATDGSFSAEANGQTVSTSWDTSINYGAVTFPAGGGCPTSGSVSGSAEVTANGSSYSGDYDYTFDGTCT